MSVSWDQLSPEIQGMYERGETVTTLTGPEKEQFYIRNSGFDSRGKHQIYAFDTRKERAEHVRGHNLNVTQNGGWYVVSITKEQAEQLINEGKGWYVALEYWNR